MDWELPQGVSDASGLEQVSLCVRGSLRQIVLQSPGLTEDSGTAWWVCAPKIGTQLPLMSEVAERIRCGPGWGVGSLPQPQELQLFGDVIIQSMHRMVWPPVWFEPDCSMTCQSEGTPGLQRWRSGSLTHGASSVELRGRVFLPREMSMGGCHHRFDSRTFVLQNPKELCLQKFPSPPQEANFLWFVNFP